MSTGVIVCLLLSGVVLAWLAAPRDKKAETKHDGLIFGTVWDRNNQPVEGMRVKIRPSRENKIRWEVYSNHAGEFEQLVPAGRYVVWADVKRPKKARKSDRGNHWSPPQVTVQVQNDVRVDIGLHLTE
ncbi:MAG TPA: carboxypeptidase-like regulatory domain-containing protein [Terriglobales bacterium]|nr:carboxypeptidase-like regulatory domain-containing protein [Terriglobales bacterium]